MAARYVGVMCRRLCSGTVVPTPAAEVVKKPGFRERLRTGKMATWVKSLLHDYSEACKDIVVGAKERPGKAAFYITLLAGAGVCSSKAPSEDSFQCAVLDASASLLLLSAWTRSGKSDQHVQRLTNLWNQGRLRYLNLIFFSLIYETPYDSECDLYPASCPHLQPRWKDFPSRVLDIGFFSHWWFLHFKMKDYDVNEEEFARLPVHMRTINWNDLHSEENERLFQSKYLPVVMPEVPDVVPDQQIKEI
ncbi:mitochondrial import inner membrane translocase subunit Tim29 [Bombina bombina]|uniref:mitochondrial import inner membrane translocase subunit Tim29 n=1 Tax=Bombina bombina TaxID=8345 RepID=UPI00235ABAD3|nr:mitochondrial import inner membrane translocase subunit Tim29 [Bombina bombina]